MRHLKCGNLYLNYLNAQLKPKFFETLSNKCLKITLQYRQYFEVLILINASQLSIELVELPSLFSRCGNSSQVKNLLRIKRFPHSVGFR
jgi:hypothetical protein